MGFAERQGSKRNKNFGSARGTLKYGRWDEVEAATERESFVQDMG